MKFMACVMALVMIHAMPWLALLAGAAMLLVGAASIALTENRPCL